MDILVVGNGGREQALATKLAESSEVDSIYIAQGNGGTDDIHKAENVDISPLDFDGLTRFARQNHVDLTVVGPDRSLERGIVDEFQNQKLTIFGPTKAQSRIEWDRRFAKELAEISDIPTGPNQDFDNLLSATNYAKLRENWPLFVKKNGLDDGKGAKCCDNQELLEQHLEGLEVEGFFKSGGSVVIEDYVVGEEASHHAFCDGKNHLSIPFLVCDHKTIYANNQGPMTGGMGVVGPLTLYSPAEVEGLGARFVAPVVKQLGFRGLLFSGLKGPKNQERNLEWNARFGDPETQVFMRLIKSDLLPILMACVEGDLDEIDQPEWHFDRSVVALVMAANGYPVDFKIGSVIEGMSRAAAVEGVSVIHAGTKQNESGQFEVNSGRVINLVAEGANLRTALNRAFLAANKIYTYPKLQIRPDLGQSALRGL